MSITLYIKRNYQNIPGTFPLVLYPVKMPWHHPPQTKLSARMIPVLLSHSSGLLNPCLHSVSCSSSLVCPYLGVQLQFALNKIEIHKISFVKTSSMSSRHSR